MCWKRCMWIIYVCYTWVFGMCFGILFYLYCVLCECGMGPKVPLAEGRKYVGAASSINLLLNLK